MFFRLALLLIGMHFGVRRPQAECLKYGPQSVVLAGTVFTEQHFGPPGFGEDTLSDLREHVPMLNLDSRIDVCPDSVGTTPQRGYHGIAKLQLLGPRRLRLNAFIGRKVVIEGKLIEHFSAGHYTDVLLLVGSIKLADGRRVMPAKA